jgi:hypothetical protein
MSAATREADKRQIERLRRARTNMLRRMLGLPPYQWRPLR